MATHYDTSAGGNVMDDRNYMETDSELVGQTGNDTLIATTGLDVLWGEWIGFDSRYYFTDGDDTAQILWGDTTQAVTLEAAAASGTNVFSYAKEGDGSTRQVKMNRIDHVDIVTGSGDDLLAGTKKNWDRIDGGAGFDRWTDDFSLEPTPMQVNMAEISTPTGQTFADGSVIKNIEAVGISSYYPNSRLVLTKGDDTFRDHGDYDDRIDGHEGDDLYVLSGGKDLIIDPTGEDTLRVLWSDETAGIEVTSPFGGTGTAVVGYGKGVASTHQIDFQGIDHLDVRAGSGDDILEGKDYSWDKFHGGKGMDLWKDDLGNLKRAVVDMAKVSSAGGQSFSDGTVVKRIEAANLTLTDGNDRFIDKGNYDDRAVGEDGSDIFTHSGGRDIFIGGPGNDTLKLEWKGINKKTIVNNDDDSMAYVKMGPGFDDSTRRVDFRAVEKIIARLGNRNDLAETGDGDDQLYGYDGNDTLSGNAGRDFLSGGADDDVVSGGGGNDTLLGGPGHDNLSDGKGDDLLSGSTGNDTLSGGAGKDTLDGGKGVDMLKGGGGVDHFILTKGAGHANIEDFQDGKDKIGLDDGLTFNKIRIVDKGAYSLIEVKSTGEDLARVMGVDASDLDAGDFFIL